MRRLFEGGARPVSFSHIFKNYILSKSLATILCGKSFVNIYVKQNDV